MSASQLFADELRFAELEVRIRSMILDLHGPVVKDTDALGKRVHQLFDIEERHDETKKDVALLRTELRAEESRAAESVATVEEKLSAAVVDVQTDLSGTKARAAAAEIGLELLGESVEKLKNRFEDERSKTEKNVEKLKQKLKEVEDLLFTTRGEVEECAKEAEVTDLESKVDAKMKQNREAVDELSDGLKGLFAKTEYLQREQTKLGEVAASQLKRSQAMEMKVSTILDAGGRSFGKEQSSSGGGGLAAQTATFLREIRSGFRDEMTKMRKEGKDILTAVEEVRNEIAEKMDEMRAEFQKKMKEVRENSAFGGDHGSRRNVARGGMRGAHGHFSQRQSVESAGGSAASPASVGSGVPPRKSFSRPSSFYNLPHQSSPGSPSSNRRGSMDSNMPFPRRSFDSTTGSNADVEADLARRSFPLGGARKQSSASLGGGTASTAQHSRGQIARDHGVPDATTGAYLHGNSPDLHVHGTSRRNSFGFGTGRTVRRLRAASIESQEAHDFFREKFLRAGGSQADLPVPDVPPLFNDLDDLDNIIRERSGETEGSGAKKSGEVDVKEKGVKGVVVYGVVGKNIRVNQPVKEIVVSDPDILIAPGSAAAVGSDGTTGSLMQLQYDAAEAQIPVSGPVPPQQVGAPSASYLRTRPEHVGLLHPARFLEPRVKNAEVTINVLLNCVRALFGAVQQLVLANAVSSPMSAASPNHLQNLGVLGSPLATRHAQDQPEAEDSSAACLDPASEFRENASDYSARERELLQNIMHGAAPPQLGTGSNIRSKRGTTTASSRPGKKMRLGLGGPPPGWIGLAPAPAVPQQAKRSEHPPGASQQPILHSKRCFEKQVRQPKLLTSGVRAELHEQSGAQQVELVGGAVRGQDHDPGSGGDSADQIRTLLEESDDELTIKADMLSGKGRNVVAVAESGAGPLREQQAVAEDGGSQDPLQHDPSVNAAPGPGEDATTTPSIGKKQVNLSQKHRSNIKKKYKNIFGNGGGEEPSTERGADDSEQPAGVPASQTNDTGGTTHRRKSRVLGMLASAARQLDDIISPTKRSAARAANTGQSEHSA